MLHELEHLPKGNHIKRVAECLLFALNGHPKLLSRCLHLGGKADVATPLSLSSCVSWLRNARDVWQVETTLQLSEPNLPDATTHKAERECCQYPQDCDHRTCPYVLGS
jgi:hypothetical protein